MSTSQGQRPDPRALIVPVGGTPEPVIKAMDTVCTDHVVFLVSPESRQKVDEVLAAVKKRPQWLRIVETPDAERIEESYRALSRSIPEILREWRIGWEEVAVDITGGTKPMVAALALATIHHATRYVYIGGKRTKDGVGIVETGAEKPIDSANPWTLLAVDSMRFFRWAFNRFQFTAAAQAARRIQDQTSQSERRKYKALEQLAHGYDAWEKLQHGIAIDDFNKADGILAVMADNDTAIGALCHTLKQHVELLAEIRASLREEAPSEPLLRDLLANAMRRGQEARYDDAVARLYRFVEGTAQMRLWDGFGIKSAGVKATDIPDALSEKREAALRKGQIQIGLKDSWGLLAAKGDELAAKIIPLLQDKQPLANALQCRNNSALAHGTRPVKKEDFEQLYRIALDLFSMTEADLVTFPKFPED